jgi:hypothetical protein
MYNVPTRINGHLVLEFKDHCNGYVTVMVHRAHDDSYIVATWWPNLGESWSWGHYLDSRDEADFVFTDVSKRNARRG